MFNIIYTRNMEACPKKELSPNICKDSVKCLLLHPTRLSLCHSYSWNQNVNDDETPFSPISTPIDANSLPSTPAFVIS